MTHQKRALVTGGAGLIGSHVTDHLVREGWTVRILDNLEPQTHRLGKPAWVNEKAEFVHGDLTDRATDPRRDGRHRRDLPSGRVRRLHARDRQVREG